MSINFGKVLFVSASLAIGGLAFHGTACAADAFAEPVSIKGVNGFKLSAFPAAGERGVSFNLQLPKGLKDLDLSKCGGTADDGFSRCAYSAESGMFNAILLRLDGELLSTREYSLGQIALPNVARQKLLTVEPTNIIGAQQHKASPEVGRSDRHSSKAEH
jgi:hypothetical protein